MKRKRAGAETWVVVGKFFDGLRLRRDTQEAWT